jgi:hypothetical protein
MCGVGALCCLPIVVWNVQHDWISYRHVTALRGGYDPTFYWSGPLLFVGGQFVLLLGFWFLAWVWSMVAHNPLRESDDGMRFLWWLSAPMFGLFLAFSVKTGGGELNWPVTAYISGLVLTAPWLAARLRPALAWRRATIASLAATCLLGLALTFAIHYSHWLHPLLDRFTGPPTGDNPMPMRRIDPTCRLRGWKYLASVIDRLREEIREAEGEEPVLAGSNWTLPGELGFYCAGHPQAYSLGEKLSDRHSQYDLWYSPASHPQDFRGKTFIVVNLMEADRAKLAPAFREIGPSTRVEYQENSHPVAIWSVTVCRGFRGFDQPASRHRRH